jgi:hypothetical protein
MPHTNTPSPASRPGHLARLTGALATALLLLGLAAATAAPAGATTLGDDEPGEEFPLFDFTDRFYKANGVKLDALVGRRSGSDGLSVVDTSPDRSHRDVRVTFTLPAYSDSGDTLFWTVMSDLAPNPFTKNAAGREAKKLADESPVYVFPTRDGDQLGVGNNRQANMIDMRHGYFSNNPLGLWVHVFVSYTDAAFDTPAGRAALAELEDRNGLALDGTPIITDIGELEDLEDLGFVKLQKRPKTDQGRYFVCPVFKDPRDGGITPDAFLATVRQADGSPLPAEQHFVDDFLSLQETGDWS